MEFGHCNNAYSHRSGAPLLWEYALFTGSFAALRMTILFYERYCVEGGFANRYYHRLQFICGECMHSIEGEYTQRVANQERDVNGQDERLTPPLTSLSRLAIGQARGATAFWNVAPLNCPLSRQI